MSRMDNHDAEQRRRLMDAYPRHDELTDHWGVPEDRPSAAVVWVVMAGIATSTVGVCAGLVWWLL